MKNRELIISIASFVAIAVVASVALISYWAKLPVRSKTEARVKELIHSE